MATGRELALERALIDLADLHHRMLSPSKLHDPRHQEFWECDCLTCKKVMELVGDTPIFKAWKEGENR